MSVISHISIKAKILSIAVPIVLVALVSTGVLTYFCNDTSRPYSAFMTRDSVATIHIAHTGAALLAVPYTASQLLV